MVHIIPHHWNWAAGQHLDLHIFSNCDSVELFLNGVSLGKRGLFRGSGILAERYRFIWHDIEWQAGEIRAVGFRNNLPCAEEILRTVGTPAKLRLETARTQCASDGEDMLFVTVSAVDRDGNLFCPFPIDGKIIGDSGGRCRKSDIYGTLPSARMHTVFRESGRLS